MFQIIESAECGIERKYEQLFLLLPWVCMSLISRKGGIFEKLILPELILKKAPPKNHLNGWEIVFIWAF